MTLPASVGMDIYIKSVLDCTKEAKGKVLRQVVLDQILVEVFQHEQGFRLAEAQKTVPFEDQLMTIRVKKETVFMKTYSSWTSRFRV
jgi:hypothetical protein